MNGLMDWWMIGPESKENAKMLDLCALTNRLIIVSMHFLFNGARVFQPAIPFQWRVRKPALLYLETPFYFETIINSNICL